MKYADEIEDIKGLSSQQRLHFFLTLIHDFGLVGRMVAREPTSTKALSALVEVQMRLASQTRSEMLGDPDYPDGAIVELILANIEHPSLSEWTEGIWQRALQSAKEYRAN